MTNISRWDKTRFSRWNVGAGAELDAEVLASPDWHVVEDETGVAGEFAVRIGKSADGKLVVTGLVMGDGEITSNTLRAIQLGEVIKTIQWRESGSLPPRNVGEVDDVTGLARFEGMSEEIEDVAVQVEQESRRGRRGPTRSDLERFAAIYRKHKRYSNSPMTSTAREIPTTRSTANRRAQRCLELGISLEPDWKEDDK